MEKAFGKQGHASEEGRISGRREDICQDARPENVAMENVVMENIAMEQVAMEQVAMHITEIESFADLVERGSYVDKTGFFEPFLDKEPDAALFTRPRRFGKTIFMSMLAEFFDMTKDSKNLFAGLKVSANKKLCDEWMNQYPVVSLTFKSINKKNWTNALQSLQSIVGVSWTPRFRKPSRKWRSAPATSRSGPKNSQKSSTGAWPSTREPARWTSKSSDTRKRRGTRPLRSICSAQAHKRLWI